MGQTSVTSINLILECIEINNKNSLNLILNIEQDLDNDHQTVDKLCYDLIKNFKLTEDQTRHVFSYMRCSSSLERIGDLSVKIVNHLNKILEIDDDLLKTKELLILARFIKNLINKSIMSLINKNIEMANESISDEKENEILKNKIVKSCIEAMRNNGGYIPKFFEIISISNNLEKIGRLCKHIAENTIYIVLNKDLRSVDD
ncbi:MAG TPA: PhoU domain-containing protein [Spirochaetota bacterium]|nr:PhoU domain-containing protein [Spirochaetota bacterium]